MDVTPVPFFYCACFLWRQLFTVWSSNCLIPVSYTHIRAHETKAKRVCRLLREKKKRVSYINSVTYENLVKLNCDVVLVYKYYIVTPTCSI